MFKGISLRWLNGAAQRCAVGAMALALTTCAPPGADPADRTPEEQAMLLAAEIDAAVPPEGVRIAALLPPDVDEPESLMGLELADGQRLIVMGPPMDGGPVITGARIEYATGELVLQQVNRSGGVSVTFATGDAFDIEATDAGLRLTVTVAATTPPSTLVIDVGSGGDATVDETASVLHAVENASYGNLKRQSVSSPIQRKMGIRMQDADDCTWLGGISDLLDALCIGWSVYTSGAPTEAMKRGCIAADLFLDRLRGSLPFHPDEEIRSRIIATMKVSLALSCEFLTRVWENGRLVSMISAPDLFCYAKSLADEFSRLVTTGGVALDDLACESLYGIVCANTCVDSDNGQCDDGRAGAASSSCPLGTDCRDCGAVGETIPASLDCSGDGECNLDCPSTSLDPDCTAAEICARRLYCCTGDGICDAAFCPRGAEDDPDCADCQTCCAGDAICDTTCEEGVTDPDCTNLDYCMRLEVCCDDDRCDSPDFPCPEEDYDCAFCSQEDDVCIANCDPPDPDCSAVSWVRAGAAQVNPQNAETEFINDSNPGDLDSVNYSISATSIGSTTRKVDNDVEIWNVSFNSTFNEPPATLTPGEVVTIDVSFSASGNVVAGFNPNFIFQVGGLGVGITPTVSYTYDPYSDFFDGISTTSFSFTVPPLHDGQISITAFWWNCEACNVTWVYERG